MSGGVGGVDPNDSVPSIFPEETINVPVVEGPESAVGVTVDPEPDFLELATSVRAGIELPEGQFSLIEWMQIISQVIQKLRESLNESDFLDPELSKGFFFECHLRDGGCV